MKPRGGGLVIVVLMAMLYVAVPSALAATPTIVTTASPSVQVGGPIGDTATLSGGDAPTGTIAFDVFGPNNPTCVGPPLFSSVKPVSGNGSYTSDPYTTSAAGTYQFVAGYSGDANNTAVTSPCGAPGETVVVTRRTATIATIASPSVPVGGQISDTATLAGGLAPTGMITFSLFGPNDFTCSGPPAFVSIKTVSGNGNYSSDPFTTTVAGTYQFVADYSGDANHSPVTTACSDPSESVAVTPGGLLTPTITTTASPSVPLGGQIGDTATLAGGSAPTGTITFSLFGPNDATCSGPPAFVSTKPVSGNGSYSSDAFTPTAAGTYRFTAAYSGDVAHNPVSTACNDPNESVVVTPQAIPTIVTAASPTVVYGGPVSDTATLSGGASPTGTITFTLFGPNDPACTGAPVFTSTVAVSGNGSYSSSLFVPPAPGTYEFVAVYSGDASNAAVTSPCGAPNESVVVTALPTSIVTMASASWMPLGGQIHDTASLLGGPGLTGSITFTLFGPNDPTCAGAPVFTSTVAVSGNGNYSSGSFTPAAPGTYQFVAVYSGDAINPGATSPCGAPLESVVVGPSPLTLTTVASASVAIGGAISDTATLSGAPLGPFPTPTGTITFTLFGPNDATCAGAPAFTSTVPMTGNGNYLSGPFTPTVVGTYRFVAAYSGDAAYAAVSGACNDPNESVAVTQRTPTITWAQPAPIVYGTPLSATQLSATASVPGTFAYSPAAGTVLDAGPSQTLSVVFTPTDTANYNTANASVQITVLRAPTTLTAQPLLSFGRPLFGRVSFGRLSFGRLSIGQIGATLTRSDTGAPVAGETIVFTTAGATLCSATTNGAGVATCPGSLLSALRALFGLGYRASFAGDNNYLPATATAGLFSLATA